MKHILIVAIFVLLSIAMAAENGGNATVPHAPKAGPAIKPAPVAKKEAPKKPDVPAKKEKSEDEEEQEEEQQDEESEEEKPVKKDEDSEEEEDDEEKEEAAREQKEEEEDDETEEEKEAKALEEQRLEDEKTKKDFESAFDSSEDFSIDTLGTDYNWDLLPRSGLEGYYLSGHNGFDDMDQEQIDNEFDKIQKLGTIVELLDPSARSFNNIPQSLNQTRRINCAANDGTYKAHFLTTQGSKNSFVVRTKRSSKVANCTVRVSTDGDNFVPITPLGHKYFKFPCARKPGYEQIEFRLPKALIAEKGAVVQLEVDTKYGTVVQCADIIVQRLKSVMQTQKCEPHCKNGGVCLNGECVCGKAFSGQYCEERVDANGSLSFLMFLFMIGLFIAGIGLLYQRDKFREEIKNYYQGRQSQEDRYPGDALNQNPADFYPNGGNAFPPGQNHKFNQNMPGNLGLS